MTTTLGKRKRWTVEAPITREQDNDGSGPDELDAQEIFRRHFEAQFKPLPAVKKQIQEVKEESENDPEDESAWSGFSDEEEGSAQVVEHKDVESRLAIMSKEEIKAFMKSVPPSSTTKVPTLRDKEGTAIEEDDVSEAANLKKDLALQRLIAESHLLESSSNPTLVGNNRHKAIDMRLQVLGSKTSILKQEKMPMSHRKGIIAKAGQREETRRREAKENGIILEKAKMSLKKGSEGKRDRGVGAPAIGKFSGGTLKLSKKDIFDIEGPRSSSTGRDRGRRKRGR